MDNYFESTLHDELRWELLYQIEHLDTVHEEPENESSYRSQGSQTVSLQRNFITLFGNHPKLEDRIYSSCSICEQVFNPRVVATHKEQCPGKGKSQSPQLKKKVKTKKKSVPPPPPPPIKKIIKKNKTVNVVPNFQKESLGPPVLSKFSDIVPSLIPRLTPDVLPISEPVNTLIEETPITSSPPSPLFTILPLEEAVVSSNNRHKKSKKITKAPKELSNEIQINETQKITVSKPVTTPNAKLGKSTPGKSKPLEKKSTNEVRIPSPVRILPAKTKITDYIFPVIKLEQIECDTKFDGITEMPEPIVKLTELPKNELHDEVESDDRSNQSESGYCSVETSLSTKTTPLMYYNPISPLFVVTQFIQKENNVFVENSPDPPSNGFFLALPETSTSIKLYKTHPKPAIMPSFGARKVGGAILRSNPHLEYQREDIKMAIKTKRMATSSTNCKTYTVPPPRSIILRPKGLNKVNCKRPSTEKISTSDSKQLKLSSDVNGFIVHTDMSDVAEVPPPNHCIQENINLLNMK